MKSRGFRYFFTNWKYPRNFECNEPSNQVLMCTAVVKVPRCCKNSGQTQWSMAASTSTIAQRSGQTLSVWISQLPIVRFKKCAADGAGTVKAHNFQDVWVLEGKRESPYEKKASLTKTIKTKHLVKMKMVLTNVPPLIITSPHFFQLLVLHFFPMLDLSHAPSCASIRSIGWGF